MTQENVAGNTRAAVKLCLFLIAGYFLVSAGAWVGRANAQRKSAVHPLVEKFFHKRAVELSANSEFVAALERLTELAPPDCEFELNALAAAELDLEAAQASYDDAEQMYNECIMGGDPDPNPPPDPPPP